MSQVTPRFQSLFHIFEIELLPLLEITPVIETTINKLHNPTFKVCVLTPPPKPSDEATREYTFELICLQI